MEGEFYVRQVTERLTINQNLLTLWLVDHRVTNNVNSLHTRWRDSNVVTIATNFDMNEIGFGKQFVKGNCEVDIP